jgi:hypothetical protein
MRGFLKRFFPGSGDPTRPENSQPTSPAESENNQPTNQPTGTARPEKNQPTGTAESERAEYGKDPTRGEEPKTTETWDSRQRCLVVETEQVLEPSISKFMINLTGGEVYIIGTNKQQPELIITERFFDDSKPEAEEFYNFCQQKGSGVNVRVVDSESLLVTGEGSSGVVSGGVSGAIVISGSDVGGGVYMNGQRIESSQPKKPRRETQVVLKVPAKNVNEGEKPETANEGKEPEPAYFIEIDSGNITFENTTGKYDILVRSGNITFENATGKCDILVGSGNITFKKCNIAESEIKNINGNTEVIRTELRLTTITSENGNVKATETTLDSSRIIITKTGNVKVIDGRFKGENTVEIKTGNISVKFAENQGKIEVQKVQTIQTGLSRGTIQKNTLFEEVENPNGQTAILRLITQVGGIEVIRNKT